MTFKKSNMFFETLDFSHPSKKHYDINHWRINRKKQIFTGDVLYFYPSIGDAIETGINAEIDKAHNGFKFDEYKDVNK